MPHFGRFDMVPAASLAPTSVTAGASPYAFTAQADGVVFISGGTLSAISYARGGTVLALGLNNTFIPVLKGDVVTVTWAISAPTVTFIQGRQQP